MTQLPSINKTETPAPFVPKVTKPKAEKPTFTAATIEVPMMEHVFEGYFSNRLDMKLTTRQQSTLKAILFGLQSKFAKLDNGKEVANAVDAVKWLLENVR